MRAERKGGLRKQFMIHQRIVFTVILCAFHLLPQSNYAADVSKTTWWSATRLPFLAKVQHSPITTIRGTSENSVWIESVGSVFEYDGVELVEHEVLWTNDVRVPKKRVQDIFETPSGDVYLISESHDLYLKSTVGRQFVPLPVENLSLSTKGFSESRTFINHQEAFLISNQDLFLFAFGDRSLKQVPITINGKAQDIAYVLPLIDNRHFVVTTAGGIIELRHIGDSLEFYESINCQLTNGDIAHAAALKDSSVILVNTDQTINQVKISANTCDTSPAGSRFDVHAENATINDLIVLSDTETIVAATDIGVVVSNPSYTRLVSSSNSPSPTDEMVSLTEVGNGVVWVGSFLGPLALRNTGIAELRSLGTEKGPSVVSIDSDSNTAVHVATYKDVYAESLDSDQNRTFRKVKTPEGTAGISTLHVTNANLWIGYQDGSYAVAAQGSEFSTCDDQNNQSGARSSPITGIVEADSGSASAIISRLNGTVWAINECHEEQLVETHLITNGGTALYSLASSQAGIWAFGPTGAFLIQSETEVQRAQMNEGRTYSPQIPSAWTKTSEFDSLTFVTPSGVITEVENSNLDPAYYHSFQLPVDSTVYALERDSNGGYWAATQSGLWRYSDETEKIELIQSTPDNGIFLDFGASHKSFDGRLFFGGTGGLLVLDDPSRMGLRSNPRIRMGFIQLPSRRIKNFGPSGAEHVHFEHSSNQITFGIRNESISEPQFVSLEYKLYGYDLDWKTIYSRNTITYSNLPAGDYVFRARGTDSAGNKSVNEISINVHVAGPVWQTWWAILLYALTALLLGAIAKKAYDRHLISKARLEFAENKADAFERLEYAYQDQLELNQQLVQRQSPAAHELLSTIETAFDAIAAEDNAALAPPLISMGEVSELLHDVENIAERTSTREFCDLRSLTEQVIARLASDFPAAASALILNDVTAQKAPLRDARYLTIIAYELLKAVSLRREFQSPGDALIAVSADWQSEQKDGTNRLLITVTDNGTPQEDSRLFDASLAVSHHLTESLGGSVRQESALENRLEVSLELGS